MAPSLVVCVSGNIVPKKKRVMKQETVDAVQTVVITKIPNTPEKKRRKHRMNKKVTPFILEEKVKQIIIKPVKRALGVPPEVNALGVPPEVNALGVPPEVNALGVPPEVNALGVPPEVNAFGVPPEVNAFGVPPEVNALGVPPEVNALEPVTFDYNWDYFDDEGIHKTDCLHGGTYFPTLIGYFRAL
jgi:hypothetical protein